MIKIEQELEKKYHEKTNDKEASEKIKFLLKRALNRIITNIEKIDTMRPIDKIRNGIPMRLKAWLKGMYIIYDYGQLFLINSNDCSIIEINDISLFLEHKDNEWEEHDISEDTINIPKEVVYYFHDNIYSELMYSDLLDENDRNILISMSLLLDRFSN